MIDPFWIAMVAGAVFIGCALGVASLTNRAEREDDEMRREMQKRETGWDQ